MFLDQLTVLFSLPFSTSENWIVDFSFIYGANSQTFGIYLFALVGVYLVNKKLKMANQVFIAVHSNTMIYKNRKLIFPFVNNGVFLQVAVDVEANILWLSFLLSLIVNHLKYDLEQCSLKNDICIRHWSVILFYIVDFLHFIVHFFIYI